MKEDIVGEKRRREENTEKLITKLGDDILKLQDMLNQEKRVFYFNLATFLQYLLNLRLEKKPSHKCINYLKRSMINYPLKLS